MKHRPVASISVRVPCVSSCITLVIAMSYMEPYNWRTHGTHRTMFSSPYQSGHSQLFLGVIFYRVFQNPFACMTCPCWVVGVNTVCVSRCECTAPRFRQGCILMLLAVHECIILCDPFSFSGINPDQNACLPADALMQAKWKLVFVVPLASSQQAAQIKFRLQHRQCLQTSVDCWLSSKVEETIKKRAFLCGSNYPNDMHSKPKHYAYGLSLSLSWADVSATGIKR